MVWCIANNYFSKPPVQGVFFCLKNACFNKGRTRPVNTFKNFSGVFTPCNLYDGFTGPFCAIIVYDTIISTGVIMAKAKIQKKYTSGLKKSTADKRRAEFRKRIEGKVKGKAQYKPVAGDTIGKKNLRPSKHTIQLKELRMQIAEKATKLKGRQGDRFVTAVASVTGIPKSIIDEVYRKGMQAWTVGHRAGVSQTGWARARVYSFLNKGKTATTADASLYLKAKKALQKKNSKFKLK